MNGDQDDTDKCVLHRFFAVTRETAGSGVASLEFQIKLQSVSMRIGDDESHCNEPVNLDINK